MSLIRKKEFTKDEIMGYSSEDGTNVDIIKYIIKHYNNIEKCNFLIKWGHVLSYSSIRTIIMTINVKDNKKTGNENEEELHTFLKLLGFGDLFEREFAITNSHIIEEVNKLIRKNEYDNIIDKVSPASSNYFNFLENHDLFGGAIIDTVNTILLSEYAARQILTMEKFAPYFDNILARISDDKLLFILKDGKLSSREQLRKVLSRMRFTSFPFSISAILNDCKSEDKSYYETLVDLIFELEIPIEGLSYYNINMTKLNKNTRIKIIENMYSCYYVEDQKIIDFIEEKDLEYDELKLIVNKFCNRKDVDILRKLLEVDKLSDFYDDIFESIINIEGISYNDIKKIGLSKLNEDNRKKYIDIAINTIEDITKLVDFAVRKQNCLSEDNINVITKKVCESDNAYIIYSYTLLMDSLVINYIPDLSNAILKTDDINHIYLFLENISNIPNGTKEELKQKIISSRNMKYICLLAVFVDEALIKKLFESKDKMYQFIVSSQLYDNDELIGITNKMYNRPEKMDELNTLFRNNINKLNRESVFDGNQIKDDISDGIKKFKTSLENFGLSIGSDERIANLRKVMEAESDRMKEFRNLAINEEVISDLIKSMKTEFDKMKGLRYTNPDKDKKDNK